MSKPRQTQHFAEIEYCLQNYFNSQLAPVMKEAQTYLTQKQVEEIGAYHASTAGVLRSLANGANRVEQMMIDRMAVEQMPKSSVEYILRKGAEGSLLGLAQGMMKSPLQQEIERRGEAAYRPSGAEKAWGTAVGVGMDTVMMGGISFYGTHALPISICIPVIRSNSRLYLAIRFSSNTFSSIPTFSGL